MSMQKLYSVLAATVIPLSIVVNVVPFFVQHLNVVSLALVEYLKAIKFSAGLSELLISAEQNPPQNLRFDITGPVLILNRNTGQTSRVTKS